MMNNNKSSWSKENLGSPMDGKAGVDYPTYDEYEGMDDEDGKSEWLAEYATYCEEYDENYKPF